MARETIPYTGISETGFLMMVAPDVIKYCDWYAEDGLFLPPEFANDPAAWTQILRDIQAGFEAYVNENTDNGVFSTPEDEVLMYNGIEKFYQYIKYLWK